MYNAYFGFKETPFSIAPDPRYLYMTTQYRDALAHLVYGLNSNGGCILLTGEVGTGKTTICRCLLEQIPEKVNIALVLNPKISELELLESICDELNIKYPENTTSTKTFTDRINQFLIEHNSKNEHTVLIIDEAQNLSSDVLEQLRLLTNLETDQRKLLQIIILGQPELLDMLAQQKMRQLAQRITARYHLKPLSREELKGYLSHRLAIAGQNIQIFPEATIKRLYKLTGGVPRLINIICDRALLGCYVENSFSVEPEILNKAAKEVFGELKKVEKRQSQPKKNILLLAIIISGIFITVALLQFKPEIKNASLFPSKTGILQTGLTKHKSEEKPGAVIPSSLSQQATPLQINNKSDSKDSALSFKKIIDQNPGNSKIAAYQHLFNQWHLKYDTRKPSMACKQASNAGLNCLHKQGNLNSLLRYNRPAVLKLFNPSGKNTYATLLYIKKNIATIIINQTTLNIDTKVLDKHWLGQYTLLWHQPISYQHPVTPGERGYIVNWLAQSIATINHTHQAMQTNNYYQGKIIHQVRQFQRQQQLTADGVVGPVTIINLNTALGMQVPTLRQ